MTMTISSFEVVVADTDGELLLTMNRSPNLPLINGQELPFSISDNKIVVNAIPNFAFADLPSEVIEAVRKMRKIRMAEFSSKGISRLTTLRLT